MPLNAFIVRPFGVKEVPVSSADIHAKLDALSKLETKHRVVQSARSLGAAGPWSAQISFDDIDHLLIQRTMTALGIKAETTEAVVRAGNIREDMFNRLVTADVVIADLTFYNPNVYYELGVRQAFRDKYTFIIRSDLSHYPFDLQTDRYFAYDLKELVEKPDAVAERLVKALRATLTSPDADSPIFKLLPQLEAEDRARFITVPEDFREEVEWARHQRRNEHLSLMAAECDGYLWEVEGLRVIGRAQFECNFIEAARSTWEQIVSRYPDDVEGNTVLSTVYQRLSDMKKSEQALSRVARTRSLTTSRLSQLRALSGRNLKAGWCDRWRSIAPGAGPCEKRQQEALRSPLLQRAFEQFHEAFKLDLNHSYAGLNALTLLIIQTELAERHRSVWESIQRLPADAARELTRRKERIRQLIPALQLAVESDRERLQQQGQNDPWFLLLEAAVACIVSNQPEYVAQLFVQAVHFAPESAEASIKSSLGVYEELGITGKLEDVDPEIGSIDRNVKRALAVLSSSESRPVSAKERQRILMFTGLRVDTSTELTRFPQSVVEEARKRIEEAIDEEVKKDGGGIAFGIAAGANGGDLLFHEACKQKNIPTRLCLALRKPQYVGQYVAPAGKEWIERFSTIYNHIADQQKKRSSGTAEAYNGAEDTGYGIRVFSEFAELPRWLQSKPLYNVGRRNNQWMLQYAIASAQELGPDPEITLLALCDEQSHRALGVGGIGDLVRKAAQLGIKVVHIKVPDAKAGDVAPVSPTRTHTPPRLVEPSEANAL